MALRYQHVPASGSRLGVRGSLRLSVRGEQVPKTVVVLPAGWAADQVGAHARQLGVGVGAVEFQLDVVVQLVEADLAAHLGLVRPEQAIDQPVAHRRPPSWSAWSGSSPRWSRWARSLRRASWIVLYSAPLVEPSRSARTSMGTSPATTVNSTSRW